RVEHGAANQIADEIFPGGKRHPISQLDQDFVSTQLFRFVNRRGIRKMKNPVLRMIAVNPEFAQAHRAWPFIAMSQINVFKGRQAGRLISEELGKPLALVSARTQDARHKNPFLLIRGEFQSSSISSVKRLCSFIPAAPSSVRIAFAVRPCRPITLPKSSG